MKDMLSGFYRPLDRLSDENAKLSDSPGAGNTLLFASSRGVRGHVRDKYCQHNRVLKLPWRGYGSSRKNIFFIRGLVIPNYHSANPGGKNTLVAAPPVGRSRDRNITSLGKRDDLCKEN